MGCSSLRIAVNVKYCNGECIIPSKIVNVNISKILGAVFLRILTKENEEKVEVRFNLYFLRITPFASIINSLKILISFLSDHVDPHVYCFSQKVVTFFSRKKQKLFFFVFFFFWKKL